MNDQQRLLREAVNSGFVFGHQKDGETRQVVEVDNDGFFLQEESPEEETGSEVKASNMQLLLLCSVSHTALYIIELLKKEKRHLSRKNLPGYVFEICEDPLFRGREVAQVLPNKGCSGIWEDLGMLSDPLVAEPNTHSLCSWERDIGVYDFDDFGHFKDQNFKKK